MQHTLRAGIRVHRREPRVESVDTSSTCSHIIPVHSIHISDGIRCKEEVLLRLRELETTTYLRVLALDNSSVSA